MRYFKNVDGSGEGSVNIKFGKQGLKVQNLSQSQTLCHDNVYALFRLLYSRIVVFSETICCDNVLLFALNLEGLQRQLDALALFSDLRYLMVNLGKTKVMISNGLKKLLSYHYFLFKGVKGEGINTYSFLGL